MRRILFLTRGFVTDEDQLLFINPVQWYLQLRHRESQSRDQYQWLDPILYFMDRDAVWQDLVTLDPDILCISVYAWNRADIYDIAQRYRQHRPDAVIVAGGPDIDAHKNLSFFQQHGFIDYAIYGDGEEIMSNLLDHLAGITAELFNLVENRAGATEVHPHRIFRDAALMSQSPYLTFRDSIQRVSQHLRRIYPGYQQAMVWETVKGCPYRCSYCDWSAGLHNKVRSWKNNAFQELDLFSELGFDFIEWTNPNYGLMPQDLDIAKYWANLGQHGQHVPRAFTWNFAKVDKTRSIEIFDLFIKAGLIDFLKFDLQDADKQVLDLNDRPEQPLAELIPLMENVTQRYPQLLSHRRSRINYILALPGQTLQHVQRNIDLAFDLGLRPNHFALQLVPNSPAFEPLFRRLHGLETRDLVSLTQQFGSAIVPGQTTRNTVNLDTVIRTRYMSTTAWVQCLLMDLYIKKSWGRTDIDVMRRWLRDHQQQLSNMAQAITDANQDSREFIFGIPGDQGWQPIDFGTDYEL